jgi:ATP-dependent Zn protease
VEVQTGDVVEKVPIPKEDRQSLIEDLKKAHVAIDAKEPDRAGYWFKLISSFFLPILLLVGFMFMFRSAKKSNTNYSFAPSQDIAKLQNEVSELKTQVSEIKSSLDALSDRLSSNNP